METPNNKISSKPSDSILKPEVVVTCSSPPEVDKNKCRLLVSSAKIESPATCYSSCSYPFQPIMDDLTLAASTGLTFGCGSSSCRFSPHHQSSDSASTPDGHGTMNILQQQQQPYRRLTSSFMAYDGGSCPNGNHYFAQ